MEREKEVREEGVELGERKGRRKKNRLKGGDREKGRKGKVEKIKRANRGKGRGERES